MNERGSERETSAEEEEVMKSREWRTAAESTWLIRTQLMRADAFKKLFNILKYRIKSL